MSTSQDLTLMCERLYDAAAEQIDNAPALAQRMLQMANRVADYIDIVGQLTIEERDTHHIAVFENRCMAEAPTEAQARSLGVAAVLAERMCSTDSLVFLSPDLIPEQFDLSNPHRRYHQTDLRDALGILVWSEPRFYGRGDVSYVGHVSGPSHCANFGPSSSRDALLAQMNRDATDLVATLLGRI